MEQERERGDGRAGCDEDAGLSRKGFRESGREEI